MALITDKKAFFEMAKLKTETVKFGDGNEVIVSELGALDFVDIWNNPDFEADNKEGVDLQKLIPALIVMAVVDEAGARVFSDEDIYELARINRHVYLKIAGVARDLNGLGVAVKNSEASQEEDSLSDSP